MATKMKRTLITLMCPRRIWEKLLADLSRLMTAGTPVCVVVMMVPFLGNEDEHGYELSTPFLCAAWSF